jgi:hypothetical protein
VVLGALVVVAAWGCATGAGREAPSTNALDASKGVASADGAMVWFGALELGVEGQGWTQIKHPYDRLPAEAEGVVREAVWSLSHHSAGMSVRFVTDSPTIAARWSARSGSLAMNHMPATGVSGLDLYVKQNGAWGWVAVGVPGKQQGNESTLIAKAPGGFHEYLLYLPLYNGIESLAIGVKAGTTLGKAPAYPSNRAKPMLFWGTSILQGGCASRPGMAYPSIIGRRMQRPTINLGFSGNGKMDPELTALIAKLEVAAYVIDCAPNMDPDLIAERTEPLVQTLRKAHPETPIVLVENVPYQQGWFLEAKRDAYVKKNAALKAAYGRLTAQGVKRLYYVPCDRLLGSDHEATVDGTHATDLGFLRMADAIEPILRRSLR